jgi:hypothetical protein
MTPFLILNRAIKQITLLISSREVIRMQSIGLAPKTT